MQNKNNLQDNLNIKRSITIASLIMISSVLLSRIMGLVREQVLAGFEGTSSNMSAYVASFLIPEFLNHLLAGGFLSITFIPIFQKYLITREKEKSWKVFSNLLTVGSIVLFFLIILSMIFAKQIIGLLGEGAPLELTTRLTRIILPAQIFFYWGAFLIAVQYANNKFFLPSLLPLFYNAGIILGGIFLYKKIGIEGFAWGVLAGAFAGNIVVQLPGAFSVGMKFKPIINLKDPDLKKYIILTLPLIIGLGMTFSNEIFFRFFGSFLDKSAIAAINYSLRTMLILVAVFGQATGVASYPYLSKLAAENNFKKINELMNSIIKKVSAFVIPCCAISIPISSQIIAILYQRGRFDEISTTYTAPIFSIYLIGAFPFAASTLIMRCFYANQNTIFPMTINTIFAILSIPFYFIFSKLLGASGIALASTIAMLLQFVVLYFSWENRFGTKIEIFDFWRYIFKVFFASLIGAGMCFIAKIFFTNIFWDKTFINNLLLGICSAILGIICYLIISILLKTIKIKNYLKFFIF
jgi:putative peptidoglycan lipid II flippase